MEAGLGQCGREQVARRHTPENGTRDAGEQAGGEQRGGRPMRHAEAMACDFMQRAELETASGQMPVQRRDAEG